MSHNINFTKLGEVLYELLSLETLMRSCIWRKIEKDKNLKKGLHYRWKGNKIIKNWFTDGGKYLPEVIKKYNKLIPETSVYQVNKQYITELRETIAHGWIVINLEEKSASTDKAPFILFNFTGGLKNEDKVIIKMAERMNEQWFRETLQNLREETKKVIAFSQSDSDIKEDLSVYKLWR